MNQYVCSNPETLNGCMDDFFRLLRASSDEKDEFLVPERETFFKDVAVNLAQRGEFRLYFMEIDGEKVASCICFDYADKYLLYNSGYDPEYSALSVGLLNKAFTLKDAIEEGKQSFDFLRGDERYKYNLGGQDQLVHQMIIRR
jgi:CelD/BcsL family acetyltransferase involved in cellulose biosynthesis